jgi:signal transduction histidine kinase
MLARLVEDLRTLANAESGMLTLQKEPTDIGILAQDAVNSFSGQARSQHVSIAVDAPADMPLVHIDPLRIREVLVNLLANALHHTPSGGRVSVVVRAANERITVTVEDTGSGISADDLSKIFDRFYKGAMSRGSGLGLTISRTLVTAHGGDIHAESGPDRGTRMTFTLPNE